MRLVITGALFLLVGCSTTPETTEENWQSYLNYRKKFYNYSAMPFNGFECRFESPSLSESLKRLAPQIKNAKPLYSGLVRYDQKRKDFYYEAPSMLGLKNAYWGKETSLPFLEEESELGILVYTQILNTMTNIAQLLQQFTPPTRSAFFIEEIVVGENESRVVIKLSNVDSSSRLFGTTLTNKTQVGAMEVDSRSQFTLDKQGLLPKEIIASHVSERNMIQAETKYEYAAINDVYLPRKISSLTTAEGPVSQIQSKTEVNFYECKLN